MVFTAVDEGLWTWLGVAEKQYSILNNVSLKPYKSLFVPPLVISVNFHAEDDESVKCQGVFCGNQHQVHVNFCDSVVLDDEVITV